MKAQFKYTVLIVLILCGCSNWPGPEPGDDGLSQTPSDPSGVPGTLGIPDIDPSNR